MIAVIFEVWPKSGQADTYFEMAASLKADLEQVDGFISVERFESVTQPGKFSSMSFWRDEEAIENWYCHSDHSSAQKMAEIMCSMIIAFVWRVCFEITTWLLVAHAKSFRDDAFNGAYSSFRFQSRFPLNYPRSLRQMN